MKFDARLEPKNEQVISAVSAAYDPRCREVRRCCGGSLQAPGTPRWHPVLRSFTNRAAIGTWWSLGVGLACSTVMCTTGGTCSVGTHDKSSCHAHCSEDCQTRRGASTRSRRPRQCSRRCAAPDDA